MFSKDILSNGLRLISSPVQGSQSIALVVLVKVGSRNENDDVWGGAHYIEHLMFKGTTKRPNTLVISKALDSIGAEFNAFTGKEYTVYYIKSNKKHLPLMCDVLFDMLNDSLFDAVEMDREKKVIVEEIKMYHENPLLHIDDLYERVLYDGSRLGLDIAGSKQSVLSMKREDVLAFRNSAYRSENMIVSVAGAVDDSMIATIKNAFISYGRVGRADVFREEFVINQNNARCLIDYRETEQAQLMMGFFSKKETHPDMPALTLLGVMLGGTMSSRLFISIREQKGLCYSIRAGMDAYEDIGNFQIRAGLDKERIYEAVEAICDELIHMRDDGVDDSELQRAKNYIEGKDSLVFEDSYEWARWYGMQELLGEELKTPSQKMEEFMAVTPADIKRVAEECFDIGRVSMAVIGSFKDENRFLEIFESKK